MLNTWIPLPVSWVSGLIVRWQGQASSMLKARPHATTHPVQHLPSLMVSWSPIFHSPESVSGRWR